MPNFSSYISIAVQAWARLVICVVFMFAGANFSHGSDLHHQSASSNDSHHFAAAQNQTEISILPHSHFEQENLDNELNEIAIHCGSPELQPKAEVFSYNMVVIGTVENRFQLFFAGAVLNLEPPPPRS